MFWKLSLMNFHQLSPSCMKSPLPVDDQNSGEALVSIEDLILHDHLALVWLNFGAHQLKYQDFVFQFIHPHNHSTKPLHLQPEGVFSEVYVLKKWSLKSISVEIFYIKITISNSHQCAPTKISCNSSYLVTKNDIMPQNISEMVCCNHLILQSEYVPKHIPLSSMFFHAWLNQISIIHHKHSPFKFVYSKLLVWQRGLLILTIVKNMLTGDFIITILPPSLLCWVSWVFFSNSSVVIHYVRHFLTWIQGVK